MYTLSISACSSRSLTSWGAEHVTNTLHIIVFHVGLFALMDHNYPKYRAKELTLIFDCNETKNCQYRVGNIGRARVMCIHTASCYVHYVDSEKHSLYASGSGGRAATWISECL